MPKPCSVDLRERVLEAVMAGATRREAAERFEISASSAVKWLQRFDETGSIAAKPTGGSASPLEEARGLSVGFDCRTVGFDAGRSGGGDAQATDYRQPQRGLALLRPPWDQLQKKVCGQRSKERPDVARARRRWMREQGMLDPARLVFIDETSTSTNMVRLRGRCRRGERLIGRVPQGHWKTLTFVAGLRRNKMVAPFVVDGPMNRASLLAYVEQCLKPTLKRGDTVIIDNLPAHKGAEVGRLIAAARATLLYLPKYSPDLNPIEQAFSKLKALLRKAAERTVPALCRRIGKLVAKFSAKECKNYFTHAGYASK